MVSCRYRPFRKSGQSKTPPHQEAFLNEASRPLLGGPDGDVYHLSFSRRAPPAPLGRVHLILRSLRPLRIQFAGVTPVPLPPPQAVTEQSVLTLEQLMKEMFSGTLLCPRLRGKGGAVGTKGGASAASLLQKEGRLGNEMTLSGRFALLRIQFLCHLKGRRGAGRSSVSGQPIFTVPRSHYLTISLSHYLTISLSHYFTSPLAHQPTSSLILQLMH